MVQRWTADASTAQPQATPQSGACDLLDTVSHDFRGLIGEHCERCQSGRGRCVLQLIHEVLAVGSS